MNLNFEAVVFYLFTLANRQNRKRNESLMDRQMYLHDRKITRNNFVTKKRRQILVRTLHKIFRWFAWEFWLLRVQTLIFFIYFNVGELILF